MKNIAMKRFIPWLFNLLSIVFVAATLISLAFIYYDRVGYDYLLSSQLGTISIIMSSVTILLSALSVINHSFLYKKMVSEINDGLALALLITSLVFVIASWPQGYNPNPLLASTICVGLAACSTAVAFVIRLLPIKKH